MSHHPPWLRFQAYVVGLPKTGSTSVATVFARYRTRHEWQLRDLVGPAMARRRGELTDEGFLAATSGRIRPATLEMDSATCHHLYADLLADAFPRAVFVHTVRDVASWSASLLDLVLTKRIARRFVAIDTDPWEQEYLPMLTGGGASTDPGVDVDDRDALVPLMRAWAEHLAQMTRQLPPDRTLRLRTTDIGDRTDALAALVGVPSQTLRADLSHANRGPVRLDRFAAFDSRALRAAYDAHCAGHMAELFPQEHAALLARPMSPDPQAWDRHLAAMSVWVERTVQEYGPPTPR